MIMCVTLWARGVFAEPLVTQLSFLVRLKGQFIYFSVILTWLIILCYYIARKWASRVEIVFCSLCFVDLWENRSRYRNYFNGCIARLNQITFTFGPTWQQLRKLVHNPTTPKLTPNFTLLPSLWGRKRERNSKTWHFSPGPRTLK